MHMHVAHFDRLVDKRIIEYLAKTVVVSEMELHICKIQPSCGK